MKKIVATILVCLMVCLSVVGCGKNGSDNTESNNADTSVEETTSAAEETDAE